MKVLIEYHSINIKMTNQGSTQGNSSNQIYTLENLSKYLYEILDQLIPNSNCRFYLCNLHILSSNKFKYLDNDTLQYHFNEVVQLFIDVKEQNRIHASNVNNITLDVKFNDSNDKSSTKLVAKLIQVYNPSKSIKISLDTGITLAEIQKSIAYRYLYLCTKSKKIMLNAKQEIDPNIVLSFKTENGDSNSKASQRNDEMIDEDRNITQYVKVEDGLMEDLADNMYLNTEDENSNSEALQLIDELTEEDLNITEDTLVEYGLVEDLVDNMYLTSH